VSAAGVQTFRVRQSSLGWREVALKRRRSVGGRDRS
jgi:hypothetical protein